MDTGRRGEGAGASPTSGLLPQIPEPPTLASCCARPTSKQFDVAGRPLAGRLHG